MSEVCDSGDDGGVILTLEGTLDIECCVESLKVSLWRGYRPFDCSVVITDPTGTTFPAHLQGRLARVIVVVAGGGGTR